MLRWPWRADIWPQRGIAAQAALCETLVRLRTPLASSAMQALVQVPARFAKSARKALPAFVHIQITDYADIWVRDCAPFYTSDTCWFAGFNGWDGLDPDYHADFTGRDALVAYFDLNPHQLPVTLEGGNLHTNGAGLGIYVAQSVFTTTRNPSLQASQFHRLLAQQLGLSQVLALETALHSDETGGHVDNILTFLNSSTLALSMTDDPNHPDYARCQQIYAQIQKNRLYVAGQLRVVFLPLPHLYLSEAEAESIAPGEGFQRRVGMPLCASYCNGIRFGNYYAVPQFDCPQDGLAMNQLRQAMPSLELVPVPARALLAGGGGWHCASHTVP